MSPSLPHDVDVSTNSAVASSAKHAWDSDSYRSDAQRNRDHIIEIAVEELGANPDVPLRAIARKAGVGQGTLYRHFPDRETLLWTVHQREVDRLTHAGGELLERLSPLRALQEWMRQLGAFAAAHPDVGFAMHRSIVHHGESARPGHAGCADTLSTLLAANQVAGTVRSDIASDDVLLALAGIWRLDDSEPEDRTARAERLIQIVIAGIVADAGQVGELRHLS
jgi:AcrR family transcriptional regulator